MIQMLVCNCDDGWEIEANLYETKNISENYQTLLRGQTLKRYIYKWTFFNVDRNCSKTRMFNNKNKFLKIKVNYSSAILINESIDPESLENIWYYFGSVLHKIWCMPCSNFGTTAKYSSTQ